MTTNRITDDDAEALLRGRSPHGREDLSPLADAIAGFRDSSSGGSPRPSAAAALRLDVGLAADVGLVPDEDPDAAVLAPAQASSARRRVVMEWFAGLGLAAKISMGAVVAVALGASGAGAAGAVGVLPEPAQVVFDRMTDTAVGVDAGESESIDGATRDDDGVGVGGGLENADERAGSGLDTAVEHADENADFGLETAEESAGSGIGTGEEASEGAGAPDGAGDQAGDAGPQSEDAGSQSDDPGSQADDAGSQSEDRPTPRDGADD